MHRHRHLLFLATAALLSAACAEDASTGVDLGASSGAPDLVVVVPTGVRERAVVRSVSTETEAVGPARTEHLGYGTYPSGNDPSPMPYSSIWGQRTIANFLPGQLSVIGSHYYTGNKGSVETNGKLNYAGTQLATQRSMSESSFPFLIDFAREHYIWTEARIYTDRECGLDGSGDSAHNAWWEAVMGGPVFQFHNTTRSSTSDRQYQPSCTPESPSPPPPSTGFTSGGSVEAICYLWITYDIYSGEIYDQHVMFCTDGG